MKFVSLFAALSLAGAGATAVYAQQGGSGQPSAKAQSSAGQKEMTQSKLIQSLQTAGFKNVRIVDAAYLVQASTEDGNNVLMYVNPPSAAVSGAGAGSSGMGSMGSGSGSMGSGSMGSGSSGSGMSGSGSSQGK